MKQTGANQRSHDVAWAAGFLDGEGSFTYGHARTGQFNDGNEYRVRIALSAFQNNRAPLEKLAILFGGNIGRARNPYGEVFWWAKSGASALPVLRELLPYLVNKPRQAELQILIYTAIPPRTPMKNVSLETKAQIAGWVAELKALNHRREKLDVDRLSEEAPSGPRAMWNKNPRVGVVLKDDATVKTHENPNREKQDEEPARRLAN